jgi:hypothetical protein
MSRFEKEYETLRYELNENKKYIFERPLVIITAAFVIFPSDDIKAMVPDHVCSF